MARKQKKKANWMAWFIVILMVGSAFGVMLGSFSSNRKLEYNGYKFAESDNFWILKLDGKKYEFNYYPAEVEDINVSEKAIATLKGKPYFYISINPYDEDYAEYMDFFRLELNQKLNDHSGTYISSGVLRETEKYNLPEITCENATSSVPVVVLMKSSETSIVYEDNCVLVNAKTGNDFIALKDRLLYELMGIIK